MKNYKIAMGASWTPLAQAIVPHLKEGTVMMLSGPLGAGKTTFVQELVRELGGKDVVKSPTFTLRNTYTLGGINGLSRFIHIDAYRIEHPREVMALGIEDEVATPGTCIAIEWPENLPASAIRNAHVIRVRIELQQDGARTVTVE